MIINGSIKSRGLDNELSIQSINSKIKMEDIYKNTQDLDENVNQS